MNILNIAADITKLIKSRIKTQKLQYMKLIRPRFLSVYQKLNKYHNLKTVLSELEL